MGEANGIQVGIKLLLEDRDNFQRLAQLPSLRLQGEEIYVDYFFDFPSRLLKQNSDVLRLRVPVAAGETATQKLSSLALKNNNRVERGDQMYFASHVHKLPEAVKDEILSGVDLMEVLRRHCSHAREDSNAPINCMIQKLESLENMSGAAEPIEMVGSLSSHRRVYHYVSPDSYGNETGTHEHALREKSLLQGASVRLDETDFPFGKKYEIEVTEITDPVNDVREELEHFLQLHHIKYSRSLESKSSRFMKYSEGLRAPSLDITGVHLCITGAEGYNEVLRWLENDCQTAAVIPLPSGMSQGSKYLMSQASAVSEYFAGRGELPISSHNVRDSVSQSLRHWSQFSLREDVNPNGGGSLQQAEDHEEYQENYYFDDAVEGTLRQNHCVVELRCINQGAAFILSLKKDQNVVNGSQNATTLRGEISGDIARLLLRDPTTFLKTMKDYNNVASALWSDFDLQELFVVAFYRTKRRVFTRSVTAVLPSWILQDAGRRQMSDDDDVDVQQCSANTASLSQSIIDQMPFLHIHLDLTLHDFSMPPHHYAAIAAESPSCTYGTVAAFSSTKHSVSLYEVGVTGLTPHLQELVRHWLTSTMNNLGVEWKPGNLTKVEQYLVLLLERQRHDQGDVTQHDHN
ncbi:hypothetical protein C3747_2g253 [Trypanosoma cruzi]|uniref:CYTH domain-containing protein n=2 Tax=Trypanosoma cruzi TaxID=5693 RepID=Q4DRD0_TRYCC|nr:hypothetical protein, conserved [Trypanosoma cruzi]EAN95093.1 hypothetical protein, conserved [Trypanosoma cruzi]PWV21658.1 hypothetical protein C3747_2g253 [Trypanosoma cruzi]RNC61637.1 hypothetical protein TcCL_ESM00716 [Trypanosoma cruzi]|eukprot:XP_816944.1 hypothetical protein [Trypanosoma cruzi strain CL Brener]